MTTRVSFEGHTNTSVDINGSILPLVLPAGLRMDRVHEGRTLHLTLVPERSASTFVGRLDVPYVDDRGEVQLAGLEVPPPPPWRWGDIRTMVASARRLEQDLAEGGGRQLAHDTRDVASQHDIAWEAVNACASSAKMVLVRWPTRMTRSHVLAPLETPRGTELIGETERRLGTSISLLRSATETLAPAETVRRVAVGEPWRSRSLSAVARKVINALELSSTRGVTGEIPEGFMLPIRAVARLALPSGPEIDPPFSSWPPEFAASYLSCLRVLTSLAGGGHRSGWAPLADLWRLYETWLAERTLAILVRLLGQPTWTAHGDEERIACGWEGDDWELELRHPCVFTSEPRELAGASWASVSSRLDPDIVLAARGPQGVRVAVLDAKNRSRMSPGDLATEASKYLWGIRRGAEATTGVNCVILVSPYSGDGPYSIDLARQWSIHGHPHGLRQQAIGKVGTDLDANLFRDLLVDRLGLQLA